MSPAVSNCVISCPACWKSETLQSVSFLWVSHLSFQDDISQVHQILKGGKCHGNYETKSFWIYLYVTV